ncbi:hypothetical protein DNK06_24650 [Pseudomonas daroniae]|uniref:DUF4394 domain-containing protein n=1 Tax=Phytopseudomonas daroniae TaxID=2487519 RepID=A0A4Q9QEM8_9GAMM|nr:MULTISPECIES: DUF4394 domain-containing protein [Pseudomonas]TBU71190.1 hypothetical protein DNK06_24650 [Pseudomonas daroniae]TBU73126.1 hypothetical protein DNK31_24670 [Pseudomonas sp. FRB 228]TBU86287.1 hypothetical protein DNJ99_24565 [Pseudomonas daroniae]
MNISKKMLGIAITTAALGCATANADDLLALSANGKLLHIDTKSLTVASDVQLSGVSSLRGIDVRPASGALYGLDDDGQLYTLDAKSGAASKVAKLSQALPGKGQAVVDFNPVADRLRLLAADGTSLRVNVDSGEVVVDGKVAYAKDGPYAGKTAKVVAGAYTNAYAGTEKTALYTVDLASGNLMLQNPPNDGIQQVVGKIADGLKTAALDIKSDGKGANTAYLLTGTTLHQVNLETGKASALGEIKDLPGDIIDIAVLPAR